MNLPDLPGLVGGPKGTPGTPRTPRTPGTLHADSAGSCAAQDEDLLPPGPEAKWSSAEPLSSAKQPLPLRPNPWSDGGLGQGLFSEKRSSLGGPWALGAFNCGKSRLPGMDGHLGGTTDSGARCGCRWLLDYRQAAPHCAACGVAAFLSRSAQAAARARGRGPAAGT